MAQSGFYRYIYKINGKYEIHKNNENYGAFDTLPEALYERDRFINVDWDWELYVQLPETNNAYIHINLPPFQHKTKHISIDREHWIVKGKGRNGKYRGQYYNLEEAKQVALIYNGRLIHYPTRYRVQKRIDGKTKTFGYFQTKEEAEERVNELIRNGWKK